MENCCLLNCENVYFCKVEAVMSNAITEEISELSYEEQLDLLMFIVSSLKSKRNALQETTAQKFLKLSIDDSRNADEIIKEMRETHESVRFGEDNVLFD